MTDEEMADQVFELGCTVGRALSGQPTAIVVSVLVAILGDVLTCFKEPDRLEVVASVSSRALNLALRIEHLPPAADETKH
jgi:hypothetical protein